MDAVDVAAETPADNRADPKHSGPQDGRKPGAYTTWGSALTHHRHVGIVPAAVLSSRK